jgi:hypothetical protein
MSSAVVPGLPPPAPPVITASSQRLSLPPTEPTLIDRDPQMTRILNYPPSRADDANLASISALLTTTWQQWSWLT